VSCWTGGTIGRASLATLLEGAEAVGDRCASGGNSSQPNCWLVEYRHTRSKKLSTAPVGQGRTHFIQKLHFALSTT
jgi:hypothetical protein